MKSGKCLPILKKRDPTEVSNDRPIKVPSKFKKIFEYGYLNSSNLYLTSNQIIINNATIHHFYDSVTNLLKSSWNVL